MAVASRTKANTARTSAHVTTRSGVPVNRTAARSTRNTDSWLTSSAAATIAPLDRRSPTIRPRNRTADCPHAGAGGRPANRRNGAATRLATAPIPRANRSLRSASARTAKAARNTATPATAAGSSSPVAAPVAASAASEMAGSSSLKDMFATNVTIAESATCPAVNPHEEYIRYETPTAIAPPAGTVMATVVEVWQTTAAWPRERPGMAATSIGQ